MGMIEDILPGVSAWLLVAFRLAGLFVFAPVLASVMVPMRVKALAVLAMAGAVAPMASGWDVSALEGVGVFTLASMVVGETLIGMAIGLLATIPLMSLEMSGAVMGQTMGLGLARVYNPEADFDSEMVGQLLFYLGTAGFVAAGGLETLFHLVLRTFDRVPLGAVSFRQAPAALLSEVMTSGLEMALRVSAPVVACVLVLVVVFGAIVRTMPQINIMTVGFTLKILAGLAVLAASLRAVHVAASGEADDVVHEIGRWVASLAG